MKYRIKKPEVENAIRGMFKDQSEFEFILNAVCVGQMGDTENYLRFVVNSERSVTGKRVYVDIKKSDVEEVVEYDPKVWNEYPKVKPPKEGCYQVHYEIEDVGYVRRDIYWNGKEWETNCPFVERFAFGFKPRDDEENKNESN